MKKVITLSLLSLLFFSAKAQLPFAYCIPTQLGSPCITNVTFNTINNTTSGCNNSGITPNYGFYYNTTTVNHGQTYPLSVACNGSAIVSVWIDYDSSFTWDPSEWYQVYTSGTTGTINITIPVTAKSGNIFMRIRSRVTGAQNDSSSSCLTFGSGETEDYEIRITPPPPHDIGVQAITAPTSGCSLTNHEPVSATFINGGQDTIYSFQALFSINHGTKTASEIVFPTNPIPPLTSYSYTFITPGDVSRVGADTISVYAHLVNDGNHFDDSMAISINNYSSITSFPFIEDFNGSFTNSARLNVGQNGHAYISSMARHNGSGGLLMTGDSIYSGFIPPAIGQEWNNNTNFSNTLNYCVDATNLGNSCGLLLKFDLKQTAAYNLQNSSFRVLINGTQISPTFHPTSANVGTSADPFITYTYSLQPYIGTAFSITFETRNGYDSSYYPPGDNAFLDNIWIGPHPPIDLATIKMIAPISGCGHIANDSVKVVFQDLGCANILKGDTIPFSYQSNGGGIVTENFIASDTIKLGDSIFYTFHTTLNASTPNLYSLKIFTGIRNDGDHSNDTIFASFVAQPTVNTYPWTDGFEGTIFWLNQSINGSAPWTILSNTTMNSPYIGAHGGNNLAYYSYNNGNNSKADLISPCFDFTHLNQPILRFFIGQYQYAANNVWVKIYASINGGITYSYVDSITTVNSVASYPGLWQEVQECLNSYAHQPNVKFKFRSNAYNYSDIGIDDVTIFDGTDTSAATILKDTICTGNNVVISILNSVIGRNYYLVDKNDNLMSAVYKGFGGGITFTSSILIKDTLLRIAYSDSIPYSYCLAYFKDSFKVKVYPYTQANAGVDTFLCSGIPVRLNASGGSIYQWSPTVGLSKWNIANPIANPATTTTYHLFVDNAGHCSSYDSMVLTVNQKPIANAGVNKILCRPSMSNIGIGGSPTGSAGSGIFNYIWSPSTGLNFSNVPNPLANPSATSTYTIIVRDFNGCSDTASVVVQVDPTLHKTLTTHDVTCFGLNNGSASIAVTGGTKPYAYSWGTSPPQNGISITGLSPNSYTIYVSDSLHCSILDTAIISQPSAISILMNTHTTTCGRCNGMIVPIIIGGNTPYKYSWSNGSTNDSLLNACNQKYKLHIMDANNCNGYDSATVTGPGGSSTFSVDAGSNLQICIGEKALLGGTPTLYGGSLPYSFVWTPNDSINSISLSNPTVNPIATVTYHVTATDNNGCTKSDSITIVVHPNPIANAGSDITYCKLANAVIGAPAVSGLNYQWAPTTGLNNPNIANPTVNITESVTYVVTATNSFGCTDTNSIVVTVNPEPLINAGSDVIIYNGSGTSLNATGAVNFTWSPPNGLNATVGTPVIANPTSTTTYIVKGTDALGCSSTDTVVIYVVSTGIDEISSKINLKIYPNPFNQLAAVEYSLSNNETVSILLFNASGVLLKTVASEKQSVGEHKFSLDTEKLSSGNYLLYIKTDDGIVVKKIIKQQ